MLPGYHGIPYALSRLISSASIFMVSPIIANFLVPGGVWGTLKLPNECMGSKRAAASAIMKQAGVGWELADAAGQSSRHHRRNRSRRSASGALDRSSRPHCSRERQRPVPAFPTVVGFFYHATRWQL
jgi:hypothetical protein